MVTEIETRITVGSLFTGIGGFDLALERLGFNIEWQVESDKFCQQLLDERWPNVARYGDIIDDHQRLSAVDLICGGDPCPCRSRARGDRKTRHPDLAGYFLAVVGRLRPRWVLRENVPSSDVGDFAAGLEILGYGVAVIELDARHFTAQSRRRQFVVGCSLERSSEFRRALLVQSDGYGTDTTRNWSEKAIAACVTSHPCRLDAADTYCWDEKPATFTLTRNAGLKGESGSAWGGEGRGNYLFQGRGLRVLTPEECESLQGFPRGWTSGFSRSRRRAMLGNAVNVKVVEWIGRLILEFMEAPGNKPGTANQ